MISAHWETAGTYVSTSPWPKTIYDFGNFDNRLFDITYEPKGSPEIAKEVKDLVTTTTILEDHNMGLDHGAWTVLKFIYPKADIPVFQMSLDYSKSAPFHYQLASELSSLRKKGVLIVGSGNIVHNLGRMDWRNINAKPHDWNIEFDNLVKNYINHHRFDELVAYEKLGASARLSIPTNDHYLPMLYTLGLAEKDDEIEHIYEGYQHAGISMRCFKIG
jgi:4,5-DOPA dioxygenase extradiol